MLLFCLLLRKIWDGTSTVVVFVSLTYNECRNIPLIDVELKSNSLLSGHLPSFPIWQYRIIVSFWNSTLNQRLSNESSNTWCLEGRSADISLFIEYKQLLWGIPLHLIAPFFRFSELSIVLPPDAWQPVNVFLNGVRPLLKSSCRAGLRNTRFSWQSERPLLCSACVSIYSWRIHDLQGARPPPGRQKWIQVNRSIRRHHRYQVSTGGLLWANDSSWSGSCSS